MPLVCGLGYLTESGLGGLGVIGLFFSLILAVLSYKYKEKKWTVF